jgi:DNA-directed RNA polymerase specialized sigma24 family protein
MTRRELVLKKLHSLSDEEQEYAVSELTSFVMKKLRKGSKFDRTLSGAHSEQNLGEEAVPFYVSKTITALYKPDGWDWKFEERSLAEQLIRIAKKFISDEVTKYKKLKEKEGGDPSHKFVPKDANELFDLLDTSEDDNEISEVLDKIFEVAKECTSDDDDLHYFTLRYLDGADFASISSEMDLKVEEVYVLRRKLVRRLESEKMTLIFN